MKIKLLLSGTLMNLAAPELEVSLYNNARVTTLINSLVKQYGKEFSERIAQRQIWLIVINGHSHILSAALNTKLADGDEVSIMPMMFGG
jgi:molybdopterin converting factor small subunit